MRQTVFDSLVAGALGACLATSLAPAFAKTPAECSAEYAAKRTSGAASGQSRKDYVAGCLAGTKAPDAAPDAAAETGAKTVAQCNAEYAGKKAAIVASGQTKKAFVAACLLAPASEADAPAAAPGPVETAAPDRGAKTAAQCRAEYAANRAKILAAGQTRKDYLAACRLAAAPAAASAPAEIAPAPTSRGKTAAQCNADYAANKAAIEAGGQTRRAFVTACMGATPSVPITSTAPTPDSPSDRPAPDSSSTATLALRVGSIGPGQFETDAKAQAHCPTDRVVWVDTTFGVYHYAGGYAYGKIGGDTYMCEADAKAAGDTAAFNEKHP